MIKKLILIITCSVILNADIDAKVRDLLGANDYATHKNLITHLFSNESNFYINNQIDYTKIMQELDKNGVLKSTGGANQRISFSFTANKDPKKLSEI